MNEHDIQNIRDSIMQLSGYGYSWDDIRAFNFEGAEEGLTGLIECGILPEGLTREFWEQCVREAAENVPFIAIDSNMPQEAVHALTGVGSSWQAYRNYLLGNGEGQIAKMSRESVESLERSCNWIVRHLSAGTDPGRANKGLVMGSVQSGKTANMVGLTTMAADRGYNFFIILSGTIDNLRQQTRDRFKTDLFASGSESVAWHVLDYSNNRNQMKDMTAGVDREILASQLQLSGWLPEVQNPTTARYVTVCLKQPERLRRLIDWLYREPEKTKKIRLLVIDDEADQAGINTKQIPERDPDEDDDEYEERVNRTIINQLLVNLISGRNADGELQGTHFQCVNYISFTATPYANVLNENGGLYPSDYIFSLPESKGYFGAKVIFGSTKDETYPGLDVVRMIPDKEMKSMGGGRKNPMPTSLPDELKNAVCYFLCAAALLRSRHIRNGGSRHKKPISMLIHCASTIGRQENLYDLLETFLRSDTVMQRCSEIYSREITGEKAFSRGDLADAYPDYEYLGEVADDQPPFDEISEEIAQMLNRRGHIQLSDMGTDYSRNDLFVCVDNCRANHNAPEGEIMRLKYPEDEQLALLEKAPAFIVIGGNTLARGLTIEGLVCSYFARDCKQADTLMQMARWFGYRKGYELLQRVWLPDVIVGRFEDLVRIDEYLKDEMTDFARTGRQPVEIGPRVVLTAAEKFKITAKNRMQAASLCDPFSKGEFREITEYQNSGVVLSDLLNIADRFVGHLPEPRYSECGKDLVWDNVDSELICDSFLMPYIEHLPEETDKVSMRAFVESVRSKNRNGEYLSWNVAAAGGDSRNPAWNIGNKSIHTVSRSKLRERSVIDIHSLASGRDELCDVSPEHYPQASMIHREFAQHRNDFGLGDTPLLLLYRVDKNSTPDEKHQNTRAPLGTAFDLLGFAVVIAPKRDTQAAVRISNGN